MKWLSIKKYIPPSTTEVLIRAVRHNEDEVEYDRFFIASIEDFTHIEDFDYWSLANVRKHSDLNFKNYKVTHFAMIDPIEKEESINLDTANCQTSIEGVCSECGGFYGLLKGIHTMCHCKRMSK